VKHSSFLGTSLLGMLIGHADNVYLIDVVFSRKTFLHQCTVIEVERTGLADLSQADFNR